MTKQESLAILESVYKQMSSMSDDELFDYLANNSNTFNQVIESIQTLDVSESLNIGRN